MPTILHIGTAGSTWWKKQSGTWQSAQEPSTGYVGVVVDLPEETILEISVPRIFGADRSHYIQRQLANRFPESTFRVVVPAPASGGVLDRLAPLKQTLAAVDPGEKVQLALDASRLPVAGVWSASLLLAQLGKNKSLPENLFVVLSQPAGLRIVFLKQRTPVLTRLVAAQFSAAEQAAEVIRTLRHLENTKVIERDQQRFGVLLLGDAQDMKDALSTDRLDAVPLPAPWAGQTVHDWNHVLFDLAVKGPPGQLAPLAYRASYVARQWKFASRVAMAGSVLMAAVAAGGSVHSGLQIQNERAQVGREIDRVHAALATTQKAVDAYEVSPQLLEKVLTTDAQEIASAANISTDLQHISRALSRVEGAHLKNLQWQTLDAAQPGCAKAAEVTMQTSMDPNAGGATPAPDAGRKVEVQMTVLLADGLGPRLQLQQASEISAQLGQLKGSRVWQDPALRLRTGELASGSRSADAADSRLEWCFTLAQDVPTGGGAP